MASIPFLPPKLYPIRMERFLRAIFGGEPDVAYSKMSKKLEQAFDDKYRLFLVESPEEKPVVVILPQTNDPQTTTPGAEEFSLSVISRHSFYKFRVSQPVYKDSIYLAILPAMVKLSP